MVGNFVLPEFSAEEHPPPKVEPTSKTNNSNVILILSHLYTVLLKSKLPPSHETSPFS